MLLSLFDIINPNKTSWELLFPYRLDTYLV